MSKSFKSIVTISIAVAATSMFISGCTNNSNSLTELTENQLKSLEDNEMQQVLFECKKLKKPTQSCEKAQEIAQGWAMIRFLQGGGSVFK